ncbi:MAG: hypothetical protein ABH823_01955 [bacterium]
MKTRFNRYLPILIIFLIIGCGRVAQNSATTSPTYPDKPTAGPTDLTLVSDGVTGGDFSSSDNAFTVSIPANSLAPELSANPTITPTSVSASLLLDTGETLVSSAYEIDLDSIDHFVTTDTVEVTLAFDSSEIPTDKLTRQYVYAKVYHPDEKVSLPVMGASLTSSTLTLKLKGLAKEAIFSVVYNPNMGLVSSNSVNNDSVRGAATQNIPWVTNRWDLWFDYNNGALRSWVAGLLAKSVADVTDAEIDTAVKSNILDEAVAAGSEFQSARFRQPNLMPVDDFTSTATNEFYFLIDLTSAGSSYVGGRLISYGVGYSYGILYLDLADIDENVATYIASPRHAIAHEMLHAIQLGYDIAGNTARGYKEGTATTYGVTIDQSAGEPQVRSLGSHETLKLSSWLMCDGNGFRYANQDFFAYVGRAYGSSSLIYVADLFEQMKTDVDAKVAAGETGARVAPSHKTMWGSLNSVLNSKYDSGLDTIYFEFAKQRAMEHSVASQLRSGEPSAMTFNTGLFASGDIASHSVDPTKLDSDPLEGQFRAVYPLSSRAIIITPSKTANNVSAYLTVTGSSAATTSNIKAIVYRAGQGTEFTGSRLITDFAKTSGDKLTVLISNADYTTLQSSDITYQLGASTGSTLEATVVIEGTLYPFSPQTVVGGFGSFYGTVTRTNLPTFTASEGTAITATNNETITLISDPNSISIAGGTYDLNEEGKVFEDGLGSVGISYFTPQIRDADDGSFVVFSSISGTITFSSYGTTAGERLTGNFSAQISGIRTTDEEGEESETLTGTITGVFDVELSNLTATSIKKTITN